LGGSSAESANQKGAAHFLASAAYAGNSNETGFKLVHHLEGLGAHFCAEADREKVSLLCFPLSPCLTPFLYAIYISPTTDCLYRFCYE
jgi:hypothetical protein